MMDIFQTIHNFEITLISALQTLRSPILDKIFIFLNFFDTFYFSFLLIPILWFGYDYKWGIKIFFIIIISSFLNSFFKNFFMQSRPFWEDHSLFVIFVKGFGLPSGASQKAILYAGILLKEMKRKYLKIILAVNLVFWISMSRIYLGLHFITDVFAGWILGCFILFIFYYIFPKFEKFLKRVTLSELLLITQIFPLFIFIPNLFLEHSSPFSFMLVLSSMGVGLGIVLSKKFNIFLKRPKAFLEGFFRASFAVISMLIIDFLFLKFLVPYGKIFFILRIYFMGLYLSFLISLLWKVLFIKKRT